MPREPAHLRKLIEPAVTALGYELVGVEFTGAGRQGLLRVYIDREEGITLDDCQAVSYQVSGLLDVEDPIPGQYSLEVSSPGLDRPLFQAGDFERFAGRRANVKLARPVEGRRNFKGLLLGLDDGQVMVRVDDRDYRFPVDDIDQARLVPEY
jgi:ribosome maturation factor RimP